MKNYCNTDIIDIVEESEFEVTEVDLPEVNSEDYNIKVEDFIYE